MKGEFAVTGEDDIFDSSPAAVRRRKTDDIGGGGGISNAVFRKLLRGGQLVREPLSRIELGSFCLCLFLSRMDTKHYSEWLLVSARSTTAEIA